MDKVATENVARIVGDAKKQMQVSAIKQALYYLDCAARELANAQMGVYGDTAACKLAEAETEVYMYCLESDQAHLIPEEVREQISPV